MDHALEQQLIEQFEQLPHAKQVRVLEFARGLVEDRSRRDPCGGSSEKREPTEQTTTPQGEPASNLLRFAGLFPPEDCDEIEKAIEEGCESIEPDEW